MTSVGGAITLVSCQSPDKLSLVFFLCLLGGVANTLLIMLRRQRALWVMSECRCVFVGVSSSSLGLQPRHDFQGRVQDLLCNLVFTLCLSV